MPKPKNEEQEKDRWTLLAETAAELNEVLGLQPPISTTEVSEEDLEQKIDEASALIEPEDEFTDQTQEILDEFLYEDEEEPEDEEEEEPEEEEPEADEEEPDEEEPDEDFEEEERVHNYQELLAHAEDLMKRKDIRVFVQDYPDVFGPVIEQLPDLKTGKALKEATIDHLTNLIEGDEGDEAEEVVTEEAGAEEATEAEEAEAFKEEGPDEEDEDEEQEDKKKSKSKSAPGDKSNKALAYLAWKDGEDDVDTLWEEVVEKRVKRNTVRSWVNGWKNGRNFPAIAKEEE